jgi:hypothetical protein
MSDDSVDILITMPGLDHEMAPIFDMGEGLEAVRDLKGVLRTNTQRIYDQALQNVSGIEVQYSGGTFVINRVSGHLAQSLEMVENWQGKPLAMAVNAAANYASDVEHGAPAHDMKPYLMGKTIAIRLDPAGGYRTNRPMPLDVQKRPLFGSTGRKVGSEMVIFRRVGPNSKGWIIPAQKPRPFMQAAVEKVRPMLEDDVRRALSKYVGGLSAGPSDGSDGGGIAEEPPASPPLEDETP